MNVQTVIHDNQDTSVSSKYVKVEEISGEMNHIPSLTKKKKKKKKKKIEGKLTYFKVVWPTYQM